MLNKQQIIDSNKCEELDNQGESMDCSGCSCSVCIAHTITINKRDIAKKIIFDENDLNMCPTCKEHVKSFDNYCSNCGQKIKLE